MEKTYNMIKEKLDGNICDLLMKPNMSHEDLKFLGESVDVLKDSEAAIYGVRGTNGVIIILLKKSGE